MCQTAGKSRFKSHWNGPVQTAKEEPLQSQKSLTWTIKLVCERRAFLTRRLHFAIEPMLYISVQSGPRFESASFRLRCDTPECAARCIHIDAQATSLIVREVIPP